MDTMDESLLRMTFMLDIYLDAGDMPRLDGGGVCAFRSEADEFERDRRGGGGGGIIVIRRGGQKQTR